jgi:sugar phosphate isomerase/epimerase
MKARLPLVTLFAATIFSVNVWADFHEHIGLQLWSVRATTLTKGMPASLDLVKGWGMTEVEGGGGLGSMTIEQFRAALDARGLKAPSMHVGYEALTKDVGAVIRDAKILGATYVICPWIPHQAAVDAALLQKAAADFNQWGEACRAAGLKFGYHDHGYEFVPTATAGETLFDDLIRATKPENVTFEMDVFWTYHGGGDPVKLLQKYPTRWSALHVKDIRKGAPYGQPLGHAPDTDNVAVGAGQIDWPAVIGAAEKAGVKYYFIEDETPAPLENIPATLAYLKALKL